jgi:hypothetical protein
VKYEIGCQEIIGRLVRDTVADLWDYVMDSFVTGSSDLQQDGMFHEIQSVVPVRRGETITSLD